MISQKVYLTARSESFSRLYSMAEEFGTVKVIVGLDIPFTATGMINEDKMTANQHLLIPVMNLLSGLIDMSS